MLAKFGTTTKEINSTFQPDEYLTHEMDIQIKDGCSFLSPIILLRDEVYDPSWNYVYLPKWGRYYFLHDAVIDRGIWSIQCAVDVLASWRTGIINSSAYVRRSASDYNEHLEDPTWSHTDDPTVTHQNIDVGFTENGCFLLYVCCDSGRTASTDYEGMPTLTVYKCNVGSLMALMNYMFSEDFLNIARGGMQDETTKQMVTTFFNPFQYIVKCMWVPLAYNSIPSTNRTVKFGWWEAGTTESREPFTYPVVDTHKVVKTFTFTQGTHSNWTDRNANWTNTTLYVPGFGQLTLSPDFQGKTLTGEIIFDLSTGDAGLFIKDSNGSILQSASGKLGADVQLSSLYEDYMADLGTKQALTKTAIAAAGGVGASLMQSSAGRGFLKNVGSALLGGALTQPVFNSESVDLSGNAGNIMEQIVKGLQASLQPALTTIGANGTRAILETEINAVLTITKFNRYWDIHSRLGGVCNKVRSLSGLEGYTEVVNPHVNVGATSEEITMINNFLSGGFYIE